MMALPRSEGSLKRGVGIDSIFWVGAHRICLTPKISYGETQPVTQSGHFFVHSDTGDVVGNYLHISPMLTYS